MVGEMVGGMVGDMLNTVNTARPNAPRVAP